MTTQSTPSTYTQLLCFIGIVLSSYALYVEHKTHGRNFDMGGNSINSSNSKSSTSSSSNIEYNVFGEGEEEFKALCDIDSIGASCSAVFNLPEGRLLSYLSIVPNGHLLDVPNAFLGLLYYTTIFIIEQFLYHQITFLDMKVITVTLNSLAMSSSIYLAYKLIMIKELCLLCWTTHLLNLLLLFHYGKRLFVSSFGKEKEE